MILHYLIILIVFSITGLSTVIFSSFLLGEVFGLEGNFISGSWLYRLMYLLFIPPSYSVLLVLTGTVFGRRAYFLRRVKLLWGRIIPFEWLRP